MILTLQDVNVYYGALQALFGVSLEVAEGEVVALIGANGAGKSTTLRAVSGLLRVHGTAQFDGTALNSLTSDQVVERGLIHVPEGRHVFPEMTVLENLQIGAWPRRAHATKSETLQHVLELFPRLAERRQQLAGTMSGGEQQMLAIGRGLMARPRLLMLDEPTLGLSPRLAEDIFAIVARLRDEKLTLLIVEQNVQRTLEVADRAYVLEDGRIRTSGPARDLLADATIREAYLGL